MKQRAKKKPYTVDRETAEAIVWLLGGSWHGTPHRPNDRLNSALSFGENGGGSGKL
jgi:hypothetical protein